MIITVPTIKREMINGKVKTTRGSMNLKIDTSLKAHLKWDKYFKESEKCDLNTYVTKVDKMLKAKKKDAISYMSAMKMLYCFVNSDELPSYEDFLEIFDVETMNEVLNEISKVFAEIGSTVTKN